MKYLTKFNIYQEEISKSKFIGYIFNIANIEDFKTKLKEIQKEYPKATHYCYAYAYDNYKKSNDDGEPSGTAGIPILNALINNEVNNVGLVVIRYFGGIKLGAGGLTRAYRSIADETIKSASLYELETKNKYQLIYDYSYNDQIEYYIKNNQDITNIEVKYNEKIERIISTNLDITSLVNITNGNIIINSLGTIDEIKK